MYSDNRSKHILDLIYVDIWGPFVVPSIHRHKFLLTIIDDYNSYTWIFLKKNKGEIREVISSFINLVHN